MKGNTLSVDVYLQDEDGNVLEEINWLRNPFGLNRWLDTNVEKNLLYVMLKNPERYSRIQIGNEARSLWHRVDDLQVGYFEMDLDWSWHWPRSKTPCLWSMADQHEHLWNHIDVVKVKARKPVEQTWKRYKDSPNATLVKVNQHQFTKCLPASEKDLFRSSDLASYKLHAKHWCRIGLLYSMRHELQVHISA